MLLSPELTADFSLSHPEQLGVIDLVALDLPEMKTRIAEYKRWAQLADRVVITIICCDSRVVLPEKLVVVRTKDGSTEQVLFITVPTIGSGAPSKSRLRGIQQQLENEWGVAADRISFLVTQHGDSHEINAQHDVADHAITCGLRKVLLQNSVQMTELSNWLAAWTQQYKMVHDDVTLAPDRMSLEDLRAEAPEIMALVDAIHVGSGPEGARLPRRLIIRAAYRNHHSNMALNEGSVVARVQDYVNSEVQRRKLEAGPADQKKQVGPKPTYPIGYAAYNHLTKELLFENPYACFGWESTVALPDLPPRTDRIQSPEYCLISFGTQTIPLAVRELLPHLCGTGSERFVPPADNAFRTVASLPSEATFLCALGEAMYAILHKVHPHAGDDNFKDLKKVVVVCDNDEYLAVLRKLLQYPEFVQEYLPALQLLQPEGLHVINLQLDKPEQQAEQLVIVYN